VDHDTVYLGTLSASKYTSVDSRPVTPDLSCDTDLAPTTNQPPMSPPPPRMQPSRGVSGSHSSCQAANGQAGQLQPPEWRHIPTLAYIDHQCQVLAKSYSVLYSPPRISRRLPKSVRKSAVLRVRKPASVLVSPQTAYPPTATVVQTATSLQRPRATADRLSLACSCIAGFV
jgi:hypothetical protein